MTLDREILKKRLNISEGRKSKVYKDSLGIESIGVGRNLKDRGLSEREIDFLLENDIDDVITDLDRSLPWWRKLDPVRQSVIADMCFNLGINKLKGFVNTLRMVQYGDYVGAADGMLKSLWASQVKGRATDLARMMKTGSY
jgi:lysozyme